MNPQHSNLIMRSLRGFRASILCAIVMFILSGCVTPQVGLPEGATSTTPTTAMDSDIFIAGHANAAFRVYDKNFDLTTSKADIWHRIRTGFAMPDMTTSTVTEKEKWYLNRQQYFVTTSERARRYLYYIVEEVEKRGMPMELALIPFLESAYNPEAISHAKAAGMWQFIPSTGLNFKLQQDIFRDERRDVIASTNAALDYLQLLYNMFGDWHLALAAYNWGEGNVLRAINANKRQNKPTDYLSLNMPSETQGYVPTLQALKNVIANPTAFKVELPAIQNHPFFQTVTIEQDIDVEIIVKLANISKEEFRALNPAVHKPVVLAAITPQILLPWDNADLFIKKLSAYNGRLCSWTVWQVPRNMSLAQVAAETKTPERILREVNDIPPSVLVKQGSTLLIQHTRNGASNIRLSLLQNARVDFAQLGTGRIATPSKVAVSQESQNRMRARAPDNRRALPIRVQANTVQRNNPAPRTAVQRNAAAPSKVAVGQYSQAP
ncbi:MAG: transglycosylase SLT domain-containing protein [Saezia sp.]